MTLPSLKELVSNNKKVHFTHYHAGQLWYKTDDDFAFPVPIDDIGDATFLAEDKAMLFMRYLRKRLELKQEAEEARTIFSSSYGSKNLRDTLSEVVRKVKPVIAVEIGTQQGASAILISKEMEKNTVLFTYDLFENKYRSPPYFATHAYQEKAEQNIKAANVPATVHVIKGSDQQALAHDQIDLLHIDICNCLENLQPILHKFASKVKKCILLEGGINNQWQKNHGFTSYESLLLSPEVSSSWDCTTIKDDDHYAITIMLRKNNA